MPRKRGHDVESDQWYMLREENGCSPKRVTLNVPSRFNSRLWLPRATSDPKPRSFEGSSDPCSIEFRSNAGISVNVDDVNVNATSGASCLHQYNDHEQDGLLRDKRPVRNSPVGPA